MKILRSLCTLLLIITATNVLASFSSKDRFQILFNSGNLDGEINLSTFSISIKKSSNVQDKKIILADSPINLGKVRDINYAEKSASWYYPEHDLKVILLLQDSRLNITLETNKEQDVIFPRTGQDKEMQAIIYPNSEGLFIPQNDKFWQKQLVNSELNVHEQMTMPFWGYYCDSNTVTYILYDDLNNVIQFKLFNNEKLFTQLKHHFKKIGDIIPPYHFTIVLGEKSPIAPALEYKKYLSNTNLLKTLSEKSLENKNIEKLYGAFHIYLWGSGRTEKAIDKLQELGLENLWLGYEQDPRTHKFLVTHKMINKAIDAGYLIGPYDSFHTMQDPVKSESINAIFDNLYPEACIINEDNKINIGFGGKGCHISSEALVMQQPKNKTIYTRIDEFLGTGINSYFLDCDATGELFDDYSKMHPMSKTQDRLNRIERMNYLALNKNLVLGSETSVWWSVPYLSFAHGNLSVHNSIHWPLTKSKNYGGWWPQDKPQFFLKPIHAPLDYIKAKYDPRYRIPLFQTVFHQSIITTDRWEIPHTKIANAYIERELLELLYGVPSIWSLDLEDIDKYSIYLKKLYDFFAPIHQAIAAEELKDFRWLDNNRQVQQTIFGNKLKLTANFSNEVYKSIRPNSIEVEWLKNSRKIYYTPSQLAPSS